jgi:hypothetical protein
MTARDHALEHAQFRTSPTHELVLFDRLDTHDREALADLARDPGFYGIVRPRRGQPSGSLRSVDRETALLLLTMRDPGPLPAYATQADPTGDAVRRLVLDGVLEVRHGEAFVSGPDAADTPLFTADTHDRPVAGRLGRLSWDAIAYGAALDLDDRDALAMRLYTYNRLPLSEAHATRFPDAAAILATAVDDARLRDGGWAVTTGSGGHWINCSRQGGHGRRHGGGPAEHHAMYKLYVSPLVDGWAIAVCDVLDALESAGGRQFKMAATAAGLLRPDKLVAYFDDLESLRAVADRLSARLAGQPAHGVPFTAPIDADGLLSWGVDPPASARPLSWMPQQSWRSWIASTVAGALLEVRRHAGTVPPAEFVRARLVLDDVDPDRWAPTQRLWRTSWGQPAPLAS